MKRNSEQEIIPSHPKTNIPNSLPQDTTTNIDEKIQVKMGIKADLDATFPGNIEGKGIFKLGFKLPTYLSVEGAHKLFEKVKRSKIFQNKK